MVSEPDSTMACEANVITEEQVLRSVPNKKNPGRVPKKIHKAEREKLKRDQLNELFLDLGLVLEPTRQNNGKASILGDATRILRDLIAQVESLRKENVALLTESRYVTVEKNELKDEKIALEAEISRLQNELQERLHNGTADPALVTQLTSTGLPLPQPSVPPVYVLPLHQDLQPYPEPIAAVSLPKPPSQVRRPHARYPTPSDSWPLQVLSKHPHSGSNSSSSGDEGSDKA